MSPQRIVFWSIVVIAAGIGLFVSSFANAPDPNQPEFATGGSWIAAAVGMTVIWFGSFALVVATAQWRSR